MKFLLVILAFTGVLAQVYGVCDHQVPGTFEGNPRNCSEFYMCRPGRPVLFSCPANMYFDMSSKACGYQAFCTDAAQDEDAEWELEFGPEFTPLESKEAVLEPGNSVCQGAPIGAIRLHEGTCRTFFQCTRVGPLRYECPAGTLFDNNRMYCEAADMVSCAFQKPPTAGVSNLLDLMCVGKKVGTKYAHPFSCTQYFLCNGRNVAQLFNCPRGTAYHRERKVCDFTQNVAC